MSLATSVPTTPPLLSLLALLYSCRESKIISFCKAQSSNAIWVKNQGSTFCCSTLAFVHLRIFYFLHVAEFSGVKFLLTLHSDKTSKNPNTIHYIIPKPTSTLHPTLHQTPILTPLSHLFYRVLMSQFKENVEKLWKCSCFWKISSRYLSAWYKYLIETPPASSPAEASPGSSWNSSTESSTSRSNIDS